MIRRALSLSLLLAVVLVAPVSAQVAQKPPEIVRFEAAMSELGKLKRSSEAQVAAHRRAAESALASCRTGGAGWSRIKKVRDRAQRNAYARGARALWADLREAALENAWVEVYTPHFERFLRHFDTPLSDPVLQAGIEAQRSRVAFNKAAYSFGTCATFNSLMKKVREFKVGGSHGVSGDYYAGKIYNDFVRYAGNRERAAARAHWGSRHQSAVDAASNRFKELGANEGQANYFAFAFKG
ncbi:MAG: hypothetical protein QOE69_2871 [Thermoleophilaceae bacterium]|jgi:hypothetical protein|nr:hypothetical protein [Thermoleophilaceae bacterium]MEA2408752.1 hypothetical protein [Thermoleophilaceae bacterium]